jgi:hypothetical protein
MGDYIREKLQKFYDKHWPIPRPEVQLSDSKIKAIDRVVWYCNISGNPIPELQHFNRSDVRLEYPTDDEVLSREFYHRGDTSYRVYECGHAFLDIHLLCAVFDACVYFSDKDRPSKAFEEMGKACPMCADNHSCAGNVKNIYGVSGRYVGGTVHVKTTIPKKMLLHIKSEYTEGDVVDTGGYRGLDLWILEDGEFKKVETEEYYPIWSMERGKKYGYRKILSGLIWDGAQFDKIELEHGVSLTPHSGFMCDGKEVEKSDQNLSNAIFNDEELTTCFNREMRTIKKVGKFYRIMTPFSSASEFIFYIGLDLPLQIKVSDYDLLTIDPTAESEYDGKISIYTDYYFTDLDGENKLELGMW